MISRYTRQWCTKNYLFLLCVLIVGYLFVALHADSLSFLKNLRKEADHVQHEVRVVVKSSNVQEENSLKSVNLELSQSKYLSTIELSKSLEIKNIYNYEDFIKWNRSLCSAQSDLRGPYQKVISISIYGSSSKHTDNSMFSWSTSILPFLIPLANEIKTLLPSWIIRLYIDFAGSTSLQKASIANFSNIDVCDIHDIPMFGPSLIKFLPGKMWRFLPIFDPFVDFCLSRDLDSPMLTRETETIKLWESNEENDKIFHIARDNREHSIAILGGLWGAAPVRDRKYLIDIFRPMLVPSIASRYIGTGDQTFLSDLIWTKVQTRALIFDSYSCIAFGGRPFLSQRPPDTQNCFLGCIRPCCLNNTGQAPPPKSSICPEVCRPKNHQDWIYC